MYLTLVISDIHLLRRVEHRAFTSDRFFWGTLAHLSNIVQTQDHVLRRYSNRCSIGRIQYIVGSQHQHLSFKNSLRPQWQVYGHLVTIEVRVESGTYQWVKTNCFSFNKLWLESLNPQAVQGRSTVQ